jgi:flavodoxin
MKAGRRILVAYYSLSGNTERVAKDIAMRLGAEREQIGDLKNRRGLLGYLRAAIDSIRERPAELADIGKHPDDYALTIVGTPIWAGKITPAVRAYLRMHRGRFNEVAFFTTSGSTPAENVVPAMEKLAGRQAAALAGFNYGDLRTAFLYEQKIAAFLAALQTERPLPISGEPAHAPG